VAGTQIHRPNHALAHALRQTWYCPFVLQYLRTSADMDSDQWCAIGHREVLACQLRLVFEATGRQTDFGWEKEFSFTSHRLRQEFMQQVQAIFRAEDVRSPGGTLLELGDIAPQRFCSTNFKVAHAALTAKWKLTKWDEPSNLEEQLTLIKESLRSLLTEYCKSYPGMNAGMAFEMYLHEALKPEETTADFVARLWCLDAKAREPPNTGLEFLKGRKLYSILAETIRKDDISSPLFQPAVTLVCMLQHHLNSARRHGDHVPCNRPVKWPGGRDGPSGENPLDDVIWSTEMHTVWRGGTLPREHLPFYEEMAHRSKTRSDAFYRVPQLLATSFHKRVAFEFQEQFVDNRVLWKVKLRDPNELPQDGGGGCNQATLIEKSAYKTEHEFLFSAYSAFRVLDVDSTQEVTKVTIEAVVDNGKVGEDVPCAPWC